MVYNRSIVSDDILVYSTSETTNPEHSRSTCGTSKRSDHNLVMACLTRHGLCLLMGYLIRNSSILRSNLTNIVTFYFDVKCRFVAKYMS